MKPVSAGSDPLRTSIAASMIGLMLLGFPGSTSTWASEPALVSGPRTVLSVASDPPGAVVYLDGDPRGATPLDLASVWPGDHRLRVVKQGYLENSRVLSVRSGEPQRIRVRLTPEPPGLRTSVQVEQKQEERKGRSKKALWIGLGVAAAGTGAYFALRETNKPPVAGTVVANPATGLQAVTSISFTAQGASDPNGDPLTYEWSFGDGGTATGQTATHTYQTAGAFNVSVKVSDPKGLSATASGSVTIRSLTGSWRGTQNLTTGGSYAFTMNLTQSGASVTGAYSDSFGPGSVSGTVSAPNAVRLTVNQPPFTPWTHIGAASGDFNTISGTTTGSGFTGQAFNMTRQ